ncbi:hypothetical protein G0Q06_13050 [Puniceicoccales bacterium CK1056]|uniref:Lipoprotein n=1 Tax=Oceanipulchritudo coccoides TaxID=2706888 RepID=A0A6B2M4V4_9BACT|nr:hypothetical protein [Oceanipulchritudo coccoides]NDV63386.1 hypothetical protein [Oceanipulchritudo coccoides]
MKNFLLVILVFFAGLGCSKEEPLVFPSEARIFDKNGYILLPEAGTILIKEGESIVVCDYEVDTPKRITIEAWKYYNNQKLDSARKTIEFTGAGRDIHAPAQIFGFHLTFYGYNTLAMFSTYEYAVLPVENLPLTELIGMMNGGEISFYTKK